jgi:carboxylesterase type B
MYKLKTTNFRATLDEQFISKDVFKAIFSGEFARRFRQRNMKLLIGEVEDEEVLYRLGGPKTASDLIPRLNNYYPLPVCHTLVDHYSRHYEAVGDIYTRIVGDVQVRATIRALGNALVQGQVPCKDILRYRISLPIKGMDERISREARKYFGGKVVHAFDFVHWWYGLLYLGN